MTVDNPGEQQDSMAGDAPRWGIEVVPDEGEPNGEWILLTRNDCGIGMIDTVEDAEEIVAALNAPDPVAEAAIALADHMRRCPWCQHWLPCSTRGQYLLIYDDHCRAKQSTDSTTTEAGGD